MSQNIAIVGSGFLGMTLALRLAERGDQVTLFEAANEIGGIYYREHEIRTTPPTLTDDDLARIRQRRAELFTEWESVSPGSAIELRFPTR